MKKYLSLFLMIMSLFVLAACGNTDSADEAAPETTAAPIQIAQATPAEDANDLIVYFSWSGNTRAAAEEIQRQTGADIFEIVPEIPYTDNYDEMLDTAQNEQSENVRPAIADAIDNFDGYSTVFVGYPIWWGDMPMIMYSFFDDYDFSGKTIIPFVTSGGSGFSGTIDEIKSMEPGAEITEGLSLRGDDAENSANEISEWIKKVRR